MAKGGYVPEDKGKVKFRFVEFELEGINSTIEESIKNIVNSLSRSSTISARVLPPKPASPAELPPANDDGHADVEIDAAPANDTAGEQSAPSSLTALRDSFYSQALRVPSCG